MLLSCITAGFHLFYDLAADMQIWALLTRSQWRVSDTQVTVKAHGPLVLNSIVGAGLVDVQILWNYINSWWSVLTQIWPLHCNVISCVSSLGNLSYSGDLLLITGMCCSSFVAQKHCHLWEKLGWYLPIKEVWRTISLFNK